MAIRNHTERPGYEDIPLENIEVPSYFDQEPIKENDSDETNELVNIKPVQNGK